MISRKKAVQLLNKYLDNKNTIKHMIAVEAVMKALADKLEPEKSEQYGLAGLLHDIDYETIDQETYQDHGLKSVQILKKEKADLPQSVYNAITAHNYNNLGERYKPETLIEWSLFICDSLTGLIVATALVRPSKKLEDVSLKSLEKKFKEKSFAKGTRREQIKLCREKLGISLEEFMQIALKAMKGASRELGL